MHAGVGPWPHIYIHPGCEPGHMYTYTRGANPAIYTYIYMYIYIHTCMPGWAPGHIYTCMGLYMSVLR